MPTYLFRSDDGRTIEEFHPMSACPDAIEVDGVAYLKAPCVGRGQVCVSTDEMKPRHNLPKWMPGAKEYTPRGVPVMSNKQGRNVGLVENPFLDDKNDD